MKFGQYSYLNKTKTMTATVDMLTWMRKISHQSVSFEEEL